MATRKPGKRTDSSTIIVLDDLQTTRIATSTPRHIDPGREMTKAEQAEIDNIFGAPLSHFPPLIGTTFDTTKKLGEAVRAVRTSSRLTQQELADMAGVGRRFVSELENGKATLEIGRVLTVCQALGIDILARKR